ncbi:hypothetical protein AAFF_G00101230 [Aldrovandia affinis]|uniref:Uncharacterized protein n=1 Tax=Aldrovandia affinis TaxID=143900 RepID=A0AAD7RUX5_9TELE|nr:hypothetical protein AAFF_G00101230 [Aldrovandia affinis]
MRDCSESRAVARSHPRVLIQRRGSGADVDLGRFAEPACLSIAASTSAFSHFSKRRKSIPDCLRATVLH